MYEHVARWCGSGPAEPSGSRLEWAPRSHAWQVSKEKKGKAVDAGCRDLTASWVRQRAEQSPNDNVELCDYFEVGGAALARVQRTAAY